MNPFKFKANQPNHTSIGAEHTHLKPQVSQASTWSPQNFQGKFLLHGSWESEGELLDEGARRSRWIGVGKVAWSEIIGSLQLHGYGTKPKIKLRLLSWIGPTMVAIIPKYTLGTAWPDCRPCTFFLFCMGRSCALAGGMSRPPPSFVLGSLGGNEHRDRELHEGSKPS